MFAIFYSVSIMFVQWENCVRLKLDCVTGGTWAVTRRTGFDTGVPPPVSERDLPTTTRLCPSQVIKHLENQHYFISEIV